MNEGDGIGETRRLTQRQQEVLALLQRGLGDEEIGRHIGMSPVGVRYHVDNIVAALGVESRDALVAGNVVQAGGTTRRASGSIFSVAFRAAGWSISVIGLLALGGLALFLVFAGDGGRRTSLGKLAYIVEGDVWVKALPDGEPMQLTDEGIYTFPSWSRSGEWLSASLPGSGQSRLIMRADGSFRRYADGCFWSPVEDVLACSSFGLSHLLIQTPEGEIVANHDLRAVFSSPPGFSPVTATCTAWSFDGRYLACRAFALREGVNRLTPGVPGDVYDSIWVVDAEGTSAREVFSSDPGAADGGYVGNFGWTEDGSAVVVGLYPSFEGSEDLWQDGVPIVAAPSAGGDPVSLIPILPRNMHGGRSPDGMLLFSAGEGRGTWTNKRVAVVDQRNGAFEYLTAPEVAAVQPAWSWDYEQVAYAAAPDAGPFEGLEALLSPEAGEPPEAASEARMALDGRRIWLVNADGSDQRQLTNDADYRDERPWWSADSSDILFARIDVADHASVWVIDADGNDAAMVAEVSLCQQETRARNDASPIRQASPSRCKPQFLAEDTAGPLWFGYHGFINWGAYFDWWQPEEPAGREE